MRPAAHEWDEREEFPWPSCRRPRRSAVRLGVPHERDGGQDGPHAACRRRGAVLGRCRPRMAIMGSGLAAAGISANGTPEQVMEWVPQCYGTADKVQLGAFCVSEPDAGSDVSSLRTRAVYDEKKDEWVINGTKAWITNGGIADVHVVVGRRRSRAQGPRAGELHRAEGRQGPLAGAEVQEARHPCVAHGRGRARRRAGSPVRSCWVARSASRRSSPGPVRRGTRGRSSRRWRPSRRPPTVGAQALGIARAAYEYALQYAKERKTFGKPIVMHQAIAFKLANMATEIDAARLLIWRAAWLAATAGSRTARAR